MRTSENILTDKEKEPAGLLMQECRSTRDIQSNVKSFIATAKRYTDLTELDASIVKEFIDRILVSKNSGRKGRGAGDKVQEIEIVYSLIGAFDFGKAIGQAQTSPQIAKIGMA